MYQNNEREEASLGKVAYKEARVDLSDITAPVGKCKQRDHYGPRNVGNDPTRAVHR
jgi:hypothetical protein